MPVRTAMRLPQNPLGDRRAPLDRARVLWPSDTACNLDQGAVAYQSDAWAVVRGATSSSVGAERHRVMAGRRCRSG